MKRDRGRAPCSSQAHKSSHSASFPLREVAALEFLEDLGHSGMVRVVFGEESEEEAGIDEDHSSGSP